MQALKTPILLSGVEFRSALEQELRFAFQPIVDARAGVIFGFEALLRGVDALGFTDPHAFLTHVREIGEEAEVELILRRKAALRFREIAGDGSAKLFFNTYIRLLSPVGQHDTLGTAESFDFLPPSRLCLELTEQEESDDTDSVVLLRSGFSQSLIAIDDYGTGFSGLRKLLDLQPDIVKLDRHFVANCDTSSKRRILIHHVVEFAHELALAWLLKESSARKSSELAAIWDAISFRATGSAALRSRTITNLTTLLFPLPRRRKASFQRA